ncbi:probable G-protein coupled receptor Mth-like 14 isoform X2 [Anopheles albimanus]|uniref:probable G-protein coupled receptor Mth-like 14 isoform X2 n=1 Tax=Anopheles albimanus TaxID=7167 RepID=UPI00163E3009|nr:probable G-protein coupled receptor Mth-like 14 isoform X2 [Anopheles albimanus]
MAHPSSVVLSGGCLIVVLVLLQLLQQPVNGDVGTGKPLEGTYEEYDDDGPYHRPIVVPSEGDYNYDYDGLEPPVQPVAAPAGESTTQELPFLLHGEFGGEHDPPPSDIEQLLNEKPILPVQEVHEINHKPANVTTLEPIPTTTVLPVDDDCRRYQKLPNQPMYVNSTASVIRKCCPIGQRMLHDGTRYVECGKDDFDSGPISTTFELKAIVAQLYDGCIEDREEEINLRVLAGEPCPMDYGLIAYGKRTKDSLYVIQNGSLLVVLEHMLEYYIYNAYCLDYDPLDASIMAYVCVSDVALPPDVLNGQIIMLTLCLIMAVPLLLATAFFYYVIPELHDVHGKALAMNCINFAVALLLETYFQYRTRGHRLESDEVVLESYAEYFILATFFWLMVNIANNCLHSWYFLPKHRMPQGERKRFLLYAIVAQLLPLFIILHWGLTSNGGRNVKHYFFVPIIVVLVVNKILLTATMIGLQRLKVEYYDTRIVRERLIASNRISEANELPVISCDRLNKVIYMNKYTTMLYTVMTAVWVATICIYYVTGEIPIFFDILFGFQGMFMFLFFICMRKPFRIVQNWFSRNGYCTAWCYSEPQPTEEAPPVHAAGYQETVLELEPIVTVKLARRVAAEKCAPDEHCKGGHVPKTTKKRSTNPFKYVPHDSCSHEPSTRPGC